MSAGPAAAARGVPGGPLRVLFAVQGEGRGHLTQALAAAEMLRAAGHTVVGALVGTGRRGVPPFFADALGAPVGAVASPTFAAGRDGAIRPLATAVRALCGSRAWSASLDRLGGAIDRTEPDVVVNFYEALVGAYALTRPLDVPTVAVGHQFMMAHPQYPLAPGQPLQRAAVAAYTRLAGARAAVRLALSFYPAADVPERRVRVVPPLLRADLFRLRRPPAEALPKTPRLLVYLMEPAFAARLAAWSDRTPGVAVDCFSDAPARVHSPRLRFHGLCGEHFLAHMARASGVVCTAGFESVSEAMWLGVPALMLPVPNHFEQRCNALDAAAASGGLATAGTLATFDAALDAFTARLAGGAAYPTTAARTWTAEAAGRLVGAVEEAAGRVPSLGARPARERPPESGRPFGLATA